LNERRYVENLALATQPAHQWCLTILHPHIRSKVTRGIDNQRLGYEENKGENSLLLHTQILCT